MEGIQWEYCPIPGRKSHTVFRGWHVHQWASNMVCFYPAEGDATATELEDLLARIPHRYKTYDAIAPAIAPGVYAHNCRDGTQFCTLKRRHDGSEFNHCLEIYGPLDECFALLDQLTDELFEQAGLGKPASGGPIQEGRIF